MAMGGYGNRRTYVNGVVAQHTGLTRVRNGRVPGQTACPKAMRTAGVGWAGVLCLGWRVTAGSTPSTRLAWYAVCSLGVATPLWVQLPVWRPGWVCEDPAGAGSVGQDPSSPTPQPARCWASRFCWGLRVWLVAQPRPRPPVLHRSSGPQTPKGGERGPWQAEAPAQPTEAQRGATGSLRGARGRHGEGLGARASASWCQQLVY